MTTTLPVIAAIEPPLVHATIVYNPFDPSDRNTIVIDHAPGKALTDYLGDLPADVDWSVAVNGALIDPERRPTVTLDPGDYLTVAVRPHGGKGGGKMVLRLVAMIAVPGRRSASVPSLIGGVMSVPSEAGSTAPMRSCDPPTVANAVRTWATAENSGWARSACA